MFITKLFFIMIHQIYHSILKYLLRKMLIRFARCLLLILYVGWTTLILFFGWAVIRTNCVLYLWLILWKICIVISFFNFILILKQHIVSKFNSMWTSSDPWSFRHGCINLFQSKLSLNGLFINVWYHIRRFDKRHGKRWTTQYTSWVLFREC